MTAPIRIIRAGMYEIEMRVLIWNMVYHASVSRE
jgi:hypothetical protein